MRKFKFDWAIVFLIILAMVLGLVGFRHDWPMVYGIEGQQVAASLRFAYKPQFDNFCCLTYPPLYFYLMALFYRGVAFIEKILGIVSGWDDWIFRILIDPGEATLIARAVSLMSFVFVLVGAYQTAKNLGGRIAGVMTGLLVLATPSLVTFAKYGQGEMLMLALITWSLFFSTRLLEQKSKRSDLIIAVILVGLATAIKYNAALAGIPIAVYLVVGRRSVKDWVVVIVTGLLILMLSHPFIPKLVFSRYFFDLLRINPNYAIERLEPEAIRELVSSFRTGDFEKQLHQNVFVWTLVLIKLHEGVVIWIVLSGLLIAIIRPNRVKLALILLIIGQLIWVSRLKALDNEFHYLVPLYPAALILAGDGLKWIKGWLLIVFILMWSYFWFFPLLQDQLALTKIGTEVVVKDWFEKNAGMNEVIVRGHYSPIKLISPADSSIIPIEYFAEPMNEKIKDYVMTHKIFREEVFRYEVAEPDWPKDWNHEQIREASGELRTIRYFRDIYWTVDKLIAAGVNYVVLGSSELEEAYKPSWQEPGSTLDMLYKRGQKAYRNFLEDPRVKEVFRVVPGNNYRGSELRIYQINGI